MSNSFSKVAKFAVTMSVVALAAGCQDAAPITGPEQTLSMNAPMFSQQSKAAKNLIKDQYIVVFRNGSTDVDAQTQRLVGKTKGKLKHTFKAGLKGFAASITADEAASLALDPSVAYVEQDQLVTADETVEATGKTSAGSTKSGGGGKGGKGTTSPPVPPVPVNGVYTQTGAGWNLDRVDQAALPLNQSYTYSATGTGVNAYIVDTGILISHVEFGGRATGDFSAINDGYGAIGCNGHGTHVAGTIGSATYGVAKNVKLHSVRVLDCAASGSWSDIIAGIDWVTANRVLPAVMNVSIGGGFSQAVNDAIDRAVASGVVVVVAAGNKADDACAYSPSSAGSALTVGATGSTDQSLAESNFGTCVDLVAPGEDVTSTWNTTSTSVQVMTGTSMASPHVAAAAALYLEVNPAASPIEVGDAILLKATANAISQLAPGTPNLLLRTR
jgi:subtilisin family serine protease